MTEIIVLSVALAISLFLVVKSAGYAIVHSTKIAKSLKLPNYVIGFIVIAVISVLPETFIAINSAVDGIPSFGLGTLFGSNVADLSLVFALVILLSKHDNLKIESKIIRERFIYIGLLILPILFGLNGYYSRGEGIALIVAGLLFYFFVLRKNIKRDSEHTELFSGKTVILLLVSMAILLLGAHLTVEFGVGLATRLGINPILIGMFVVGLGTTLPELFFSTKAAREHHDGLALGDILGTVVSDATIVVGIVALINPFTFNPRIVYLTGVTMVLAVILLTHFMKTDRRLTKREAFLLIFFYGISVCAELLIS